MQLRPRPVALFVVPAGADDAYDAALEELIASRPEMDSWIWRTAHGDMPALPAR
jgi:hypothetical protein